MTMDMDKLERATDRTIRSAAMTFTNAKDTFKKVCMALIAFVGAMAIIAGIIFLAGGRW